MNIVVAVSGGIDSVVLLDQLVQSAEHDLVVAHFDHGMRPDSEADSRFVEALASLYGLEFVSSREDLRGASEDQARVRRYGFLFGVAERYQARLATAHHLDDLVETIALNIKRGTRWRGLAGMSDQRIWRPLLNRTKSELKDYALERRLEWVEDETNDQYIYSRNRIRRQLASLPLGAKRRLFDLWERQVNIRERIADEIKGQDFPTSSRYFLSNIDSAVAMTLLYDEILEVTGVSLLTSQLERMLMAIKVGRPSSVYQLGGGVSIEMGLKDWHVKE